jgi:glycosyltransferase involved in cell wall biosynthesis
MRVMIWSNAPFVPSGYGKQARLLGQMLKELDHDVAYACYSGHGGSVISWDGSPLFPSGILDYGIDVLVQHAAVWQPDLLVCLGDLFKLEPIAADLGNLPCPVLGLAIFDTDCLPPAFLRTIAAGRMIPAAVSRYGQQMMPKGALYLPHAVDVDVYTVHTGEGKAALRVEAGIPEGAFLIGICGANMDIMRKGYAEQMQAFQRFSGGHDDARLMIMSVTDTPRGLPLVQMANDLGIAEKTHFISTYGQVAGLVSEEDMACWYQALDLLSMCSYGEGFGVPAIEAMACGVPVAATDCSALSELVIPHGFPVAGTRYWNAVHRGFWKRPTEKSIIAAWEKAYGEPPHLRALRSANCRKQACSGYDLWVVKEHWRAFLEEVVK